MTASKRIQSIIAPPSPISTPSLPPHHIHPHTGMMRNERIFTNLPLLLLPVNAAPKYRMRDWDFEKAPGIIEDKDLSMSSLRDSMA